jgi:DNA polymerase elongation subunit (family B)
MTAKISFFPYAWHLNEKETNTTIINVFGLNERDESVCLIVYDFTPYIYIELPEHIEWTREKVQLVAYKIDTIAGHLKPISKQLMMKKRLYGASFDKNNKRKLYPYLLCKFGTINDIRSFSYKIKGNINVNGIGSIKLKIHEIDAGPILQLVSLKKIPMSGWFDFIGREVINVDEMCSSCNHEYRVKWSNLFPSESPPLMLPNPKVMSYDLEVNSTNVTAMPNSNKPGDKVFQISCVFSIKKSLPEKEYLLTLGETIQNDVGKNVIIQHFKTEADLIDGFVKLILDENPNIIIGYNIFSFDIPYLIDRSKLTFVYDNFVRQGFIKFQKSEERIIKWTSSAFGTQEFKFINSEGRLFIDLYPLIRRDHKLSNYKLKTVSTYFLGETKDPLSPQGIFKCYRIGTQKRENNTYSEISKKAMSIVGKYCVQDSSLVLKLFYHLNVWAGLTEMATICNVPIFYLYTRGQQIRVYSQIYKYCMYENIVVEKDAYVSDKNERYLGAYVFLPKPGRYKMVVPFDFASLYPSAIIGYNIDYHTWVKNDDKTIPDSDCNIMTWEDHVGCEHDPSIISIKQLTETIVQKQSLLSELRLHKKSYTKDEYTISVNKLKVELAPLIQERSDIKKTVTKFPMCAVRKYKYIKPEKEKGVLPTVIQNLLDARKNVRSEQKKLVNELKALMLVSGEIDNNHIGNTPIDNNNINNPNHNNTKSRIEELESIIGVLESRQLAYKVSANSMYGAMGVSKGSLPFMPGAMCTTYIGRKSIAEVASIIQEKYHGELIYGDTDSNYIYFKHLKTASETWDYALKVANEVSKSFPPPMKLEFENVIYSFFFILSKKRYVYKKCFQDGVTKDELGKKGVLLARRDNSKFVRDVYENILLKIYDYVSYEDIIYYIISEIKNLFCGYKNDADFVVTKTVGAVNENMTPELYTNEKGVVKGKIGNYSVKMLDDDINIAKSQMDKKNVTNERDYYTSCLPAQIQLAERMKKRGMIVQVGSRIEYVITNPDKHTAKQYDKIESYEYFLRHKNVLKIDYLFYTKSLANPIDQVLEAGFDREKDVVLRQYKIHLQYHKVLNEIKKINMPSIVLS